MMMYPHHLQCKVTKSRTPSVLNLICYRRKNKATFIFSNENVDDDVNWASQRLPIRTVGRRYSQWKLSLTLSSSLKNIHRGAKVIVNVIVNVARL